MPLILNGDGSVGPLSATEVGYLDGVTSSVQNQINSKPTGGTGAWTSYSPTWSASGVTPTIGNGTLYAKYVQIGKTVSFNVVLTWGSTTTTTGTSWQFSVPVAPATFFTPLTGNIQNGNSGNNWRVTGFIFNNLTYLYVGDNTGAIIGSTNPTGWAANWYLSFGGTYEAA